MKKTAETEPNLITGSELARRLGVSEAAVRKAVEVGRISPAMISPNGRRWFIEETARQQWAANTTAEKKSGRQAVNRADQRRHDTNDPLKKLDPNEARAARDSAQARILTFKAMALEKELVDYEEVAKRWEKHVGEAKRLFLALPADLRLSIPILTSENMALIESRIIDILNTLSAWHPGE